MVNTVMMKKYDGGRMVIDILLQNSIQSKRSWDYSDSLFARHIQKTTIIVNVLQTFWFDFRRRLVEIGLILLEIRCSDNIPPMTAQTPSHYCYHLLVLTICWSKVIHRDHNVTFKKSLLNCVHLLKETILLRYIRSFCCCRGSVLLS